jgi:16S rRNA processing protein RimM
MAVEHETPAGSPLVMARVAAPYGVKGWVHVTTYTELPGNLLDYAPWYLYRQGQWQAVEVHSGRPHGKGLVVRLAGCDDRDAAALLTGSDIGIYREQLPPASGDEYYWNDLLGLRVSTIKGEVLGVVDHLIETGANDVLVIRGEHEYLVPFISGQVIESVDLDSREIRVDWDPDF